ncbi:MAG: thioredoxin domain-containing protein [Myxococcaceae bacterium]
MDPHGRPNRLAAESSPYLRQHATNPVDWYPWGDEALRRARDEQRPILLSVGYSACHWCHVMAHESFEDPATAALMNAHFVNVKVDREERPDLDQIYQGVVQLMGGQGGWPLTVLLTPDLVPFYGGTYFPPEPRHGLPSFRMLLDALSRAWTEKREEVLAQAGEFKNGLRQLATYGLGTLVTPVSGEDLIASGRALARALDPVEGGFGGAPKFPNTMGLALLLRAWRRSGNAALLEGALHTLDRMVTGGVHDQLGGGFHRYSVDRFWRVPHFEKMLYDNALLLHLLAEAQQVSPRADWVESAERLVAWLGREMTDAAGAFHATQDADSEGVEGKFFVWSPAELKAVLGPEDGRRAATAFGATAQGTFEHGRSVLERRVPIAELARDAGTGEDETRRWLDSVRARLLAERSTRIPPGRDDKVLAGWNGLMIRGLALAARVVERPEWAERAARAAGAVLERQLQDGRLLRVHQDGVSKVDAFLEDWGGLAAGLVALYQATFDPRWLETAVQLADGAQERFWDPEHKAYRTAPRGQADLVVEAYALHDNAVPSGASLLTEANVALAALTGRHVFLDRAEAYLSRMRDAALANPFAYGHLWCAADVLADGVPDVALVGSRDALGPFLGWLGRTYAPTVSVAAFEAGAAAPVLAELAEGKTSAGAPAAAYVCRNFTCTLPRKSPEALREELSRAGLLASAPRGGVETAAADD